MTNDRIPHSHPGKHLQELLDEWGLTQYRLAKDIDVSQTRIMEIIRGKRAITADTALRLSRYFSMSAEFWLNLQANYELDQARSKVGQDTYQAIKPLAALKSRLEQQAQTGAFRGELHWDGDLEEMRQGRYPEQD